MRTCRVCGELLPDEGRLCCSLCGQDICEDHARRQGGKTYCIRCLDEGRLPEIDWR